MRSRSRLAIILSARCDVGRCADSMLLPAASTALSARSLAALFPHDWLYGIEATSPPSAGGPRSALCPEGVGKPNDAIIAV